MEEEKEAGGEGGGGCGSATKAPQNKNSETKLYLLNYNVRNGKWGKKFESYVLLCGKHEMVILYQKNI